MSRKSVKIEEITEGWRVVTFTLKNGHKIFVNLTDDDARLVVHIKGEDRYMTVMPFNREYLYINVGNSQGEQP